MTKPLILVAIASLTLSAIALADGPTRPSGPTIEPGPARNVSTTTKEFLNVVGDNAHVFADFMSNGNTITNATVRNLRPNLTQYSLTVQHCSSGGVAYHCLGGAVLTILSESIQMGELHKTEYNTNIVLIK